MFRKQVLYGSLITLFCHEPIDDLVSTKTSPSASVITAAAAAEHGIVQTRRDYITPCHHFIMHGEVTRTR